MDLGHGAGNDVFYYGEWIRKPGVAICSCNDGVQPAIFKVEATDEEAVIDYGAIRKNGGLDRSPEEDSFKRAVVY